MATVTTEYGAYRPLSDRLPEFLDDYPPSDGYGVEIQVKDLLSIKPGLRSLYDTAISAGRSFKDCGLPELPSTKAVIIEAFLTRDGKRLASAQTYQLIEFEKDFEIAETRARQRLVAALGYNGGLLDQDEIPQRPDAIPVQHTSNTEASTTPLSLPSRHPSPEDHEPQTPIFSSGDVEDSQDSEQITPALKNQVLLKLQQLEHAGIKVPEPSAKREALELLRRPVSSDAGDAPANETESSS